MLTFIKYFLYLLTNRRAPRRRSAVQFFIFPNISKLVNLQIHAITQGVGSKPWILFLSFTDWIGNFEKTITERRTECAFILINIIFTTVSL